MPSLQNNIYYKNWEIKRQNKEHNRLVSNFIKTSDTFDMIEQIDDFTKAVSYIKGSKLNDGIVAYRGNASEQLYYGYLTEIFNYAGLKANNLLAVDGMSHGISFVKDGEYLPPGRGNYITQGISSISHIRKKMPGIPIFPLGPYIHYAEPYYSKAEARKIIDKYGKILLFFPAHTWEKTQMDFDFDMFLDSMFDRYGTEYDSLFMCIYWNDLPNVKLAKRNQERVNIISAGSRGSQYFVRRLKSFIQLSELVVSNEIGTHIGFCVYENKPLCIWPCEDSIINPRLNDDHKKSLSEARIRFQKAFPLDMNGDIGEQNRLCNYYWGFDRVRSKEDTRLILRLLRTTLRKCRGWRPKYAESIKAILEETSHASGGEGHRMHKLLSDALNEQDIDGL